MLGNFLNLNIPSNSFDCIISLHTIYHIDQKDQEHAVDKMLDLVKNNKPIIIVYSNPYSLENLIYKPIKSIIKLSQIFKYFY